MRIVLISVLSPWDDRHGGGQLCTHHLGVALAERGHELVVIYSAVGGVAPPGTPNGLPYRAEFVPDHERLYLNPFEFARRLLRLGERVDVIHNKGYEGSLLWSLPRNGALRIATTHHPDPPRLDVAPTWTRPVSRAGWARRNLFALLERRTLRGADGVICVSHHSARALVQRGYLPPEASVDVVHNGSPLEFLLRSGVRPKAGAAPLLCIARLDDHKGIDVLFQALARLDDRPDAQLDLVGTGLAEPVLRAEADRLGIGRRVRWLGYRPPNEIAELLAGARVLVLPSRSENFPLVILEAMHAGLAIVATMVGGISEAVRDGVEALLVPPGDPEALAGALRRALEDDALRGRLAAAALARADAFTWGRAAEGTERIYLELLGSPSRAPGKGAKA